MDEDQRSVTKRAFLTAVGTAVGAGCLATSELENDHNEVPPDENGSEPDPELDREFDPKPEPDESESESDEPTLFLDNDARGILWDNGRQWQSGERLDEWEVLAGSAEISRAVCTGAGNRCI